MGQAQKRGVWDPVVPPPKVEVKQGKLGTLPGSRAKDHELQEFDRHTGVAVVGRTRGSHVAPSTLLPLPELQAELSGKPTGLRDSAQSRARDFAARNTDAAKERTRSELRALREQAHAAGQAAAAAGVDVSQLPVGPGVIMRQFDSSGGVS